MKKIFIGISCLFAFNTSFAQKATVTWGELSKKEYQFSGLIQGNDGNFIKLCYDVEGGGLFGGKQTVTPMLVKFDNKFNEIKSNSFPADEKGTRLGGFFKFGGKIYLRTSIFDKENNSTSHYAQPININTLNTEGGQINLGSFVAKAGGFLRSASESSIEFKLSSDSSKLLVFALTPYSKNENEKYYMAVYDANFKKLWEKSVELEYGDKFVDMFDYFVTNSGEVGVLFKHYDQETKKESMRVDGAKVPAYKTKLLIYDAKVNKPKEMVFNVDDKFVQNVDLTTDASDNLTMFGTYKTKESGHLTGYFISTIDKKTQNISLKKMEAFPQELNDLLDEDDQGLKKEKDPGPQQYFRLREQLKRADGSLDYLLEYYRVIEHRSTDSRGFTRVYYTYHYGDIIDINISKEGKSFFVRIPKMQQGELTAFSGYKSLTIGNKLYLFYNDDIDNVDRDLKKKPDALNNFGRSAFVMTVVDNKAEFTREVLYSNKDMPVTTATVHCQRVSDNKISLYAQKISPLAKAKDQLGIVEIK